MPISAKPVSSFGPTALSSATPCAASSRRVSPSVTARELFDADEVRVERLATGLELELDVGVREPEVLRDPRRVVAVFASAPTTTVTSSESSSINSSSSAIAASAADFVATQMPSRVSAIQSPAAMGPHSATLSRTACVTSPACTRCAASSIAAVFSSIEPSGSYTTSAASASTTAVVGTTATGRSASSGTWRATGTMFLLFGSTITRVGGAMLHRFEDLRGRRVHRLATGDDVLHAETDEELLEAVAHRDRDHAGGDVLDRRGVGLRLLPDPRRFLAFLHLLVQVGDANVGGTTGDDAGLDRCADVVRVHVTVPDAVAARRPRSSRRDRPRSA